MYSISNFLGIQEIPTKARYILYKYMLLDYLGVAISIPSTTFFILYLIDAVGFTYSSVIVSVMMFVQLLIDYPSGSLGDWIGQKWVLTIANTFYIISYIILTMAETFNGYIVMAITFGVANAMVSGTLETWLDNNYKVEIGEYDPSKKIYGFSMARITTLRRLFLATSVFYGGILATQYSRRFVFILQAFFFMLYAILVIYLLKNKKSNINNTINNKNNKVRNYFIFLKGGFQSILTSRNVFFFILGFSIYSVTWIIWGNLIQFPLYFGYTGSDDLASLLRSLILFFGIPIGIANANISKKIANERYPQVIFFHIILFFPSLLILILMNPLNNEFNLQGFIFVLLIQNSLTGTLYYIGEALRQRLMVDLIPSENRNAVYSLIPTIISLFGIPLLPMAGAYTEIYGITAGIIFALFLSLIGIIFIFISFKSKKVQVETDN